MASGGVVTSQDEPSSRRSSAPASRTMPSILSSSASSLGTTMSPLRWNIQPTAPFSAMLPPFLEKRWRTSLTMRLRLLVTTCTSTPTPPGPYPSNVTSSRVSPSSVPAPRWMARSMLSLGMFSPLAVRIAVRRRGFVTGSAPPVRVAIVNSRMSLVKILPRRASVAAFLCLIVAHFECPDMNKPFTGSVAGALLQPLLRQSSSRAKNRQGTRIVLDRGPDGGGRAGAVRFEGAQVPEPRALATALRPDEPERDWFGRTQPHTTPGLYGRSVAQRSNESESQVTRRRPRLMYCSSR